MKIDKEVLRRQVLQELGNQANILEKAVASATEGSTHPDAKQEGKYDTRAIEAGYIAGAQMERLKETRAKIAMMEQIRLAEFSADDPVGPTALVELRWQGGGHDWYFLAPHVGGLVVETDERKIYVITPVSELGEALLDGYVGDEVTCQKGGKQKKAEIAGVW